MLMTLCISPGTSERYTSPCSAHHISSHLSGLNDLNPGLLSAYSLLSLQFLSFSAQANVVFSSQCTGVSDAMSPLLMLPRHNPGMLSLQSSYQEHSDISCWVNSNLKLLFRMIPSISNGLRVDLISCCGTGDRTQSLVHTTELHPSLG